MDALDGRLLSAEDVTAAFGVPVVGCLPAPRAVAGRDGERCVVEACADVTASLGLTGADRPRTLMVTPAGSGIDGYPVAARVATQLAAQGRRTLVVDADLAGTAGGGGSRTGGLAEILAGRSSLRDEIAVVHVVPAAGPGPGSFDVLSYELLPAGEPVSNPAALLGRPALATTMREASARADLVLVSSGPPAPVGRSAPLAALSDRIVLLAELRRTTIAEATEARHAMGALYDRVAGVVVIASDRRPRTRRERVVPAVAAPAAGPRAATARSNGRPMAGDAGRGREHV
jgi:Mrp family chromosome partitioning ATPase